MEDAVHNFNIIRKAGVPNKGQLPNGVWVYGQDKFYIDTYNAMIPVAPYSDHFIYELPSQYKGSKYRCSCGSPAVVVSYTGYVGDASPQGKLMVCMAHATDGKHIGGSIWI